MKLFQRRRVPSPMELARFRAAADVFVFHREDDLYVARVSAGRQRSVDRYHALLTHLPTTVAFSLECVRSEREFVGDELTLVEVREAVARLKTPLVASGGVEVSVYTDDDQVALSPLLDLWIYARSDRWLFILLREGLEEVNELPARTWTVRREEFTGASELVDAVTETAERLTLRLMSRPRRPTS